MNKIVCGIFIMSCIAFCNSHVGKFGCVRYFDGCTCSHDDPIYVITGKNKAHMGVDLLASENTSIYSSVIMERHICILE